MNRNDRTSLRMPARVNFRPEGLYAECLFHYYYHYFIFFVLFFTTLKKKKKKNSSSFHNVVQTTIEQLKRTNRVIIQDLVYQKGLLRKEIDLKLEFQKKNFELQHQIIKLKKEMEEIKQVFFFKKKFKVWTFSKMIFYRNQIMEM